MADKPTVINESGLVVEDEADSTLEQIQTIVPYFPDDERMGKYLSYISSGWTRKQALIRCGATEFDLSEWRNDPQFLEIDSSPYNDLRKEVANSYAERLVRRNVVQLLEFDEELFNLIRSKLSMGEELTKDERAFALKRAGMYGVDTLNSLKRLLGEGNSQDNDLPMEAFDIIGFAMRRRNGI